MCICLFGLGWWRGQGGTTLDDGGRMIGSYDDHCVISSCNYNHFSCHGGVTVLYPTKKYP